MLLDGFKFDLRIYVLVHSLDPLEVWSPHLGVPEELCKRAVFASKRARSHSKETRHHWWRAVVSALL